MGFFSVEAAELRDFMQPAIFSAEEEIWPLDSKSDIVWLYFRGDAANYPPPPEHPFESDMLHEWMTWTIDLLDDEERVVMNVMREYCGFAPRVS